MFEIIFIKWTCYRRLDAQKVNNQLQILSKLVPVMLQLPWCKPLTPRCHCLIAASSTARQPRHLLLLQLPIHSGLNLLIHVIDGLITEYVSGFLNRECFLGRHFVDVLDNTTDLKRTCSISQRNGQEDPFHDERKKEQDPLRYTGLLVLRVLSLAAFHTRC